MKWALAGQELLINDGQAVLVAVLGDLAHESFGCGVERGHTAHEARGALSLQVLDQPEVRNLYMVADDEQVLWLDVEVLKTVWLVVHEVERFGSIAKIAEQVGAGNADQPGALAFDEQVMDACVRPAP